MFVLAVRLSSERRRRLAWTLLLGAGLSIALSAFQLLGGEGSPLRFYEVTNPNRAVGFFANANHLTTLLICALPFTGVLAAKAMKSRSTQRKGAGLTLGMSMAVFLAVGIIVSGSMAGYALSLPAALATFLIYRRAVAGRLSRNWAVGLAAVSVVFIVATMNGPLNQQAFSDKFSSHPTSRSTIWQTTVRAIGDFAPVGSGPGSFAGVYRTFEDTRRASSEFVNHAHNDYLEIALELGLAGVAVVLAFLLWYALRAFRAWTEDIKGAALARTGSAIIGLVLLHSLVEFPLRTAAIAAAFAVACAFLVPPPAARVRRDEAEAGGADTGLRHVGVE
jgi:O-antigen ligase